MLRLQAFKFELMPDGAQTRDMRRFAGSCRVVFNEALAMQQARHADGEKTLGYADLCWMLTRWRNGEPMASGRLAPWLAEDNADRVGAINVLRRGEAWLSCEGQDTADASAGWEPTARIACEVSPIGGQQQEPAEATAQGSVRA